MEYTARGWMEGMNIAHEENDVQAINLDNSCNNVTELMNFDAYGQWCDNHNHLVQTIPSFTLSSSSSSCASSTFSWSNLSPCDSGVSMVERDMMGSLSHGRDELVFSLGENRLPFQINCVDHDLGLTKFSDNNQNQHYEVDDVGKTVIPRSLIELNERMLRALHLFKEWSPEKMLAQVWVPMKSGDEYFLSTSDQPYLLDHQFSGYREVSKLFTFSTQSKLGSFLGLPGRVFTSRIPEWTSNVMLYNEAEYMRIKYATDHGIRGSIALPIFEDDSLGRSCCAVLELVTMTEKSDFDLEMGNICRALEAVNLSSNVSSNLHRQTLSMNQRAALAEITDVLHVICHTHQLPLALTWIPCSYIEDAGDEPARVRDLGLNNRYVLCIESTACCVLDKDMLSFVHACGEHHLEEGQGIAWKAFQSNHPFFHPDVKNYHVDDYPLVHHARRCGLNAAMAIRLRSTHTGDSDYILEFFLSLDMKGSIEHQIFLNNLSITMQRICKSLRTVSDIELIKTQDSNIRLLDNIAETLPTRKLCRSYEQLLIDVESIFLDHLVENAPECSHEQMIVGSKKHMEKRRSTTEKHVSLSVLQKYFSGTLKDAARSIGVCPTTLKKICRQYGISRWPSRKINKVTRSMKKIRSVLDSVGSVERGLQFGSITRGIVAATSILQGLDPNQNIESIETTRNGDPEEFINLKDTSSCMEENKTISAAFNRNDPRLVALETRPSSATPNPAKRIKREAFEDFFTSQSSRSVAPINETTTKYINNLVVIDEDTGMTDSYSESGIGSMMIGSSSSSVSFEKRQNLDDGDSKITIKATYGEDTIRFKFDRVGGCIKLYEIVGERFNLQTGKFQLSYVDDEEECVMLLSDSDWLECLETLHLSDRRNVKIMARDIWCASRSSSGSSGSLGGAS